MLWIQVFMATFGCKSV